MLRRSLKLKTIAIVTLSTLLILAGSAVGVVKFVDQTLPGYRTELAEWVSDKLDQPLAIGGMALVWDWSGPGLRLSEVALLDKQGQPTDLRLDALTLQFTLINLITGQFVPHSVTLNGAKLVLVQTAEGGFRLRHAAAGNQRSIDLAAVGQRLQQIETIRVLDSRLHVFLNALEAPVKFTDIALSLTNHKPRHQLQINAHLADKPNQHLSLHADIKGDLTQLTATKGQLEVHAEGLSAPRLLRLVGLKTDGMNGGLTRFKLWADWTANMLPSGRAHISIDRVVAGDSKRGSGRTIIPSFRLMARAIPVDNGLRLRLKRLTSPAFTSNETTGTLTFHPQSGRLRGQFSAVPADLIGMGLRLGRPGPAQILKTKGRLSKVSFEYKPSQGWRVHSTFTNLAINGETRGIQAGPLKGSLTLTEQSGTLRLTTHDAKLRWPRYIRGRLPLEALTGTIKWQQTGSGQHIQLHKLKLVSETTQFIGGGSIQHPAQGASVVNLEFKFQSPDIAQLLEHTPQTKDMPFQRLRAWLPHAIRSGRIQGTARIRGPLDQFPFADGQDKDVFKVTLEGENVDLAYREKWPPLHNVDGTLTLNGYSLTIHGQNASIFGVAVAPSKAHIENTRKAILKVDGLVTDARASRMLAFLQHSPLKKKFGQLAEVIEVSGPASLKLHLSIPLNDKLGEPSATGRIQLSGVQLTHKLLPQAIHDIQGFVDFNGEGLRAQGLQATFLGMPLTGSIKPRSNKAEDTDTLTIQATAQLQLPEQADRLSHILPSALLQRAHGQTKLHINLGIAPTGNIFDSQLSSKLKGLALALPPPLGKSATSAVPLTIQLSDNHRRVDLTYGERLSLEAHLLNDQLQSANVIFGGVQATPPPGPGIWIGGRLPVVPIHDWWQLFSAFKGDNQPSMLLRGAQLHTAGLRLGERGIGPIELELLPLIGADGWLARIEGQGAKGHIRWLASNNQTRINANFEHVSLQSMEDNDNPEAGDHSSSAKKSLKRPVDPDTLPAFELLIADLQLNGNRLGQLQIQTDAITNGVALKTLSLKGGGLSLDANGRWVRQDGTSEATLVAHIMGKGIGQVLSALGFEQAIKAEHTDIDAQLHLTGHSKGLSLTTLDGEIHLTLKNGMLLSVEPGAGRLLGLLNFYALPRRLTLDFGDVIGKGLAFDKLAGDFQIQNGVVQSDNFHIETPAAIIRIEGSVGLATLKYDEHITIKPKIATEATIAGTVLGGPIVGAAVFLLQDLLDQPLADIATVSYHLSGTWSDPVIQSLETQKKSGGTRNANTN